MKASGIFISLLLLASVMVTIGAGCICGSNTRRGCDGYGCGHFGAPRGSRRHPGVDLVCPAGSAIKAPFAGKIVRRSNPYDLSRPGNGHKGPINNGIVFSASGRESGENCIKMFYVDPVRYTSRTHFNKGDVIGYQLNLQGVYPPRSGGRMTNHVHVQKCRSSTSPEAILACP